MDRKEVKSELEDGESDGKLLAKKENGTQPSDPKKTPTNNRKFKNSGMRHGELEKYLLKAKRPPAPPAQARPESPDLEIVFEKTSASSAELSMSNVEEDCSIIERSSPVVPEIPCFDIDDSDGEDGENMNFSPNNCARNNVQIQISDEAQESRVSIDTRTTPLSLPLGSSILGPLPTNLQPSAAAMENSDMKSVITVSSAVDSETSSEDESWAVAASKKTSRTASPAPDRKRIVSGEEKENGNQSLPALVSSQGNPPSNLIRESAKRSAAASENSLVTVNRSAEAIVSSERDRGFLKSSSPHPNPQSVLQLSVKQLANQPDEMPQYINKAIVVPLNSVEANSLEETIIPEDEKSNIRIIKVVSLSPNSALQQQNNSSTESGSVDGVEDLPRSGDHTEHQRHTKNSSSENKRSESRKRQTSENRDGPPPVKNVRLGTPIKLEGTSNVNGRRLSNSTRSPRKGAIAKKQLSHEELWENNKKAVLLALNQELPLKDCPPPKLVARIVYDGILLLSKRITKETRSLAITYFQKLIDKVTSIWKMDPSKISSVDKEKLVTGRKYFWEIFELVSEKLMEPPHRTRLVDYLLAAMKQEFKLKTEEKFALQFFKVLTNLCQKDYELHFIKRVVNTRQPLVVQLMMTEETEFACDFNAHWRIFFKHFQEFPSTSEEVAEMIILLELNVGRFKIQTAASWWDDTHLKKSGDEFAAEVASIFIGCPADNGYKLLTLIKSTNFALAVCTRIIIQLILRLFKPDSVTVNWNTVFAELAANIPEPSQLDTHRSTVSKSKEKGEEFVLPEHLTADTEAANFYKFLFSKPNQRGECNLHRICGGKKIPQYKSEGKSSDLHLNKILHRIKTERLGDINVLDHSGNTPLHEACYHGSTAAVMKLWELFTDKDEQIGPMKLDVLIQNDRGDTPLHLAVEKKHIECVRLIFQIAKLYHCDTQLARLRDYSGHTPLLKLGNAEDITANEIRQEFVEYSKRNTREYFGGLKLPENVVVSIEANRNFCRLLFHWSKLKKDNQLLEITAV